MRKLYHQLNGGACRILCSLGKLVPEHWFAALGLLTRRLVLDHVPVLDQDFVLDANNVRCNPVHGQAKVGKSSMHDHEISLGHDRSCFVLERCRKALNEIEESLTARLDMSAVLNVIG